MSDEKINIENGQHTAHPQAAPSQPCPPPNIDQRVVFGAGTGEGGMPVIALGVSEKAWEYMKDGKSHTFDLRPIGLPITLVLFGGETRESIQAILQEAAGGQAKDIGVLGEDAPAKEAGDGQ